MPPPSTRSATSFHWPPFLYARWLRAPVVPRELMADALTLGARPLPRVAPSSHRSWRVVNDSFQTVRPRRPARCCLRGNRHRHRLIGVAVAVRSIPVAKALVARWVGIVSAAWRVICSCSSSTNGSSTDAHRHSTAYGCTTINATVVNASAANSNATNANTSSICEGIS